MNSTLISDSIVIFCFIFTHFSSCLNKSYTYSLGIFFFVLLKKSSQPYKLLFGFASPVNSL